MMERLHERMQTLLWIQDGSFADLLSPSPTIWNQFVHVKVSTSLIRQAGANDYAR